MISYPALSRAVVLFIAILAPLANLTAQEAERAARRPKVGLVLSGGGALGVAHIGALKALEEMQIPIDYIAGTSMGAVVGGLYASGMSPEEIETWFRKADWHFLLSDALPRKSESFETKQRQFDNNQGIEFRVGRGGSLNLPAGFINGRNIMANLRELTVPARHVRDFRRLPIPFRAVATDIETGEMIVLRDGDLVESIRASMGIPAVFSPQVINGRKLADGGMTSNLPIRVVQEMGADVIIAINATEPLAKGEKLSTAGAMANQVLGIFIQRQMKQEIALLGANDALVRVKIEDMMATDFEKAAKGINEGYEQTIARRSTLARFSTSDASFRQFLARQRVPRGQPFLVNRITVQTPEGEFEHPLSEPLQFTTGDQERFAKIQGLIGDTGEMQKYEVGDYELLGSSEEGYELLVKARTKKLGTTSLAFGFGIDYSTTDDSDLSLRLSFRMSELNSLGAEWRTFLSTGDTTYLDTEWYQPIDWERRFFVSLSGLFTSDFIDGRDPEGDPLRFRLQDHALVFDVGARLQQWGELRLGYGRGFNRISRRLGVPDDVPASADLGWLHADLTFDTLDAANFATKGSYGRFSVIASREEFGASDNYTRAEGQIFHPITFGKNTIVPRVSAALNIGGNNTPLYDQVPLGGFLNLSGLSRGTLYGENAALAELVYYRKIGEMTPGFGRAIYAGFSVEAGEVWGDSGDFDVSDAVIAGSIFLGADTSIGALYLGVGVAEGGDAAIYLQLGTPFSQGRRVR